MTDDVASTRAPTTNAPGAAPRKAARVGPRVNGSGASRSVGSAEMVIRAITEGLYSGRYTPGQRLVEADLTREYSVSRGSVREALSRLAAEGIVTVNLHRGAQIRSLTRKEALDVLNLLEVLVGFAARTAAERLADSDNRRAFEGSLARLLEFENRSDSLGLIRARNSFYRSLVRIGGNAELARVLPKTQVHIVRVQFRSFSTASEARRFRDYNEIASAVLAADPRTAELVARRHVRGIRQDIASLPDGAFARADSRMTGRSRAATARAR